jgi:MBOAT, membrane-bound O-acyltransferase family
MHTTCLSIAEHKPAPVCTWTATSLSGLQVFHQSLNILAEVTRFGDRAFYKDWWNATTIGDFWRLWNIPVHKWMMRTVYSPLIHAGSFVMSIDLCLNLTEAGTAARESLGRRILLCVADSDCVEKEHILVVRLLVLQGSARAWPG